MIHIPVMVIESGMVLNPVLGRMSVLNHKLGSLPLRSRPDETVFSLKCETVTVRSGCPGLFLTLAVRKRAFSSLEDSPRCHKLIPLSYRIVD